MRQVFCTTVEGPSKRDSSGASTIVFGKRPEGPLGAGYRSHKQIHIFPHVEQYLPVTDRIAKINASLAGEYVLERELGVGGMATVYLAEDVRHRRKVAMKVLRDDLSASVGAARFQREIEIAAQLQHPSILPLLDS